ncbi:zf-CCHC domain-containing protein [Cucumis melo var. makuwa]|uniref:Zf-CCHC domain-containing protein n=1 Tax=Cucumis melo var. makuwa TaxID=1194695 RepID=A0A5A7T1X0_CUCMM|nr:zf-CCHC domain-containing protein [Cucumis melo var. makuwa]
MQVEMTVAKYEKRFTELVKYGLMMVAKEKDRCRRFERGLKQEIRTLMMRSVAWCKFSELVEATLRVVKELMKKAREKSKNQGSGENNKMKISYIGSFWSGTFKPHYGECDRKHTGRFREEWLSVSIEGKMGHEKPKQGVKQQGVVSTQCNN